jgi:hypothetical protein
LFFGGFWQQILDTTAIVASVTLACSECAPKNRFEDFDDDSLLFLSSSVDHQCWLVLLVPV